MKTHLFVETVLTNFVDSSMLKCAYLLDWVHCKLQKWLSAFNSFLVKTSLGFVELSKAYGSLYLELKTRLSYSAERKKGIWLFAFEVLVHQI